MKRSYMNIDQRISIYEWLKANADSLKGLTRPQIAERAAQALPDPPITKTNLAGLIDKAGIEISMRRPPGPGKKELAAKVDKLEHRLAAVEKWIGKVEDQFTRDSESC